MTYSETGGWWQEEVGILPGCPAHHLAFMHLSGLGLEITQTHHVFDQQVSGGEGDGVGGRGDWEHEGVGAADGARNHQIQGVHSQADGLRPRAGETKT